MDPEKSTHYIFYLNVFELHPHDLFWSINCCRNVNRPFCCINITSKADFTMEAIWLVEGAIVSLNLFFIIATFAHAQK